jgi:hypothetical protein
MIDNSIVKIVRSDLKTQKKFYNLMKKINLISANNETFMGIDFEFNTKKVALMQILFEVRFKTRTVKKYYIIYPPILEKSVLDYLKYDILANPNIIKILHGAESLDIPYMVEDLFEFEIEPIIDFFVSMIDTRYLCEYLNLINKEPNVCKIYELLLKFKIINQDEKTKLELNDEKMGPIYNIIIDINKLTPELITYSIHDVVYLIDAFDMLKTQIIKSNPKNYYLLVDCLRYCFMEKRWVTNVGDDLFIINMMNNYFYILNSTDSKIKVSLLKTYDIIYNEFIFQYDSIQPIVNINYIRTNILNLFRTIVFIVVLKYYTVKSSNTQTVNYNLNLNYSNIKESLMVLNLNHLLDLVNDFYNFADLKLKL